MGLLDNYTPDQLSARIRNDDLRLENQQRSKLLLQSNPDDVAKAINLGDRFGVPANVVRSDTKLFESMASSEDANEIITKSPHINRWLQANDQRLELVRDDLGNLSYFGELVQSWRELKRDVDVGYKAGVATEELGLLGYRQMMGASSPAEKERIDALDKKIQELKGTGGFAENAAKIVGQMLQGLPQHLSVGIGAAGTAIIAGQIGPQALAPEEVITAPAAFLAGTAASIGERSFRIESGHAYLDMLKEGIDEDTALFTSIGVGMVNASLEVAGFSAVAAPIKRQFSKMVGEQATKYLTKATTGQAVKNFAKDYSMAWAGEVSTEVIQEIVSITGEEIAKQITPNEVESLMATEAGREQLMDRLKSVFEEVGKGMAVLALPGASISFHYDLKAAQKAKQSEQRMLALGDGVDATKLRQRAPKEFQDFVDKLTEEGDVQNVYIGANEFKQYFQSKGLDPRDIAKEIPSVEKQYDEAITRNGDLVIPLGEYASRIAGTEYHQGLLKYSRFNQEDASISEIENDQKSNEELIQAADKIETERAKDKAFQESADKVYDQIKTELENTGRFTSDVNDKYATLHRAFSISMADRLGITPEEVYQKYGLQVRVPPPLAEPSLPPPGEAGAAGGTFQQGGESLISGTVELNGVQRQTANSKGQPIAQTEESIRNFWEWFGDSKAVDNHGRPLVVYHGTPTSGLDVISPGYREPGAWFTLSLRYAADYAKGPDGEIHHVYLNTKKPMVVMFEQTRSGFVATVDGKVLSREIDGEEEPIDNNVDIVKLAIRSGFDGVHFPEGNFSEESEAWVVFDASQIKSATGNIGTFSPDEESILRQETRAEISFPSDITQQPSVIKILKDADLSSFVHESGHFFFEVMNDIASRPDAPVQVKQDLQTLLDWYGVKDLETWKAMSTEDRRQYHEQFARGFEAYLFEGKSPNIEMQGIFRRFRAWMVNIYRSLKSLNVELTDEVRGVMDRLLATDEQIKDAETVNNYRPLFDSADQANMTKTEWSDYVSIDQKASDEAIEELDKRSLRDMKWLSNAKSKVLKELQAEAKQKRSEIKERVTKELESEPAYQAVKFLKKGEMIGPDGEEIKITEGFKLDKNALDEMFPVGELAPVPWRNLRGMTSDEGLHPDIVAQMFDFENGDQMVRTLLETPPLKEAIDARTDELMLKEYGDLVDKKALEDAANQAVHNEARIRFVATELRALAKLTGSRTTLAKAAKEYAANKISGKSVNEAIKSGQYRTSEAKSAREAEKALRKGETAKAADHKRAQILNAYMFRASEDAKVEVEKTLKYLKKFEKKSVRSNLRGEMVAQIDGLLERFDLRKSVVPTIRPPLADFVVEEADRVQAVQPDIDPTFANESYKKPYKDMTLEEFRGLRDTVKQLEHLARREQRMYLERRAMDFEAEKQSILSELRDAHSEVFNEDGTPKAYRKDTLPLMKDFYGKFKSKFDAEMVNMENLLDVMTVGKGRQIFDSLFGRLSEAADQQTRLMKELAAYLKPYTDVYSVKERFDFSGSRSRVFVPEVKEYFTRDKRIAVALFYGSEEGRQRLRDGNGYDDSQVMAIMNTLDDRDLNFIEAFWKMSDEKIWPLLKGVDERTKGVAPKKIKAVPFTVRGRDMSGGYVPLVYDGDLSTRSYDLNADDAITDLRGGTVSRATTKQSASKQRLDRVNRALELSIAGISYKINETVHDVTHREAVVDTYKLLQSNRIANVIKNIAGPDVYNSMLIKVRETAVKPVVPSGVTEKALWYFRRNTMINMMGASFNTVAINVLGVLPSINRVGPINFANSVKKLVSTEGVKRYQWVLEKSPYMKERMDGFDRDLNTEVNRFTGKQGFGPSMGTWFAGLAIMDRMITIPTWMAAYEQAMKDTNNDETASVQIADRIVRQTQGSGRVIDLAKVSGGVGPAGEFKRVFTMFYNFFSAQLGQMVRQQRISASEWNEGKRAKAAMQFTLTTFSIIVLPATLESIARGNCGEEPDATDYMYCSVRSSALFMTSMFPLLRDFMPFAWHQFDPETKAFGVRLSPIESSLDTLARTPKSIADVMTGEATENDIQTMLRGLGFAFGLPGFQAARSVDGYQALVDGETENPAVILTGAPK